MDEHADDLTVLPWPGKSPDLNVIENVWGIMEQKLTEDGRGERHSADELWRRVEQAWDSLRANTEMFAALSGSMVKRLQSVVDAAGGMTKY